MNNSIDFDTHREVLQKRKERLAFIQYMCDTYGLSAQSVRRFLVKAEHEEWEKRGMLHCIRLFDGDREDIDDVYEWFESLPKSVNEQPDVMTRRMLFYAYMKPNGLDRETIKKHMDQHDWTRLQIDGWNTALSKWKRTRR